MSEATRLESERNAYIHAVAADPEVSDAVRILLKRVVNDQAFPLELKVPNAQTRAAMEEARAMAKARTARFESADALIDDLEKARQQ